MQGCWARCGRPGRSFRVGGRSSHPCPRSFALARPLYIEIHSHLGAPVVPSYTRLLSTTPYTHSPYIYIHTHRLHTVPTCIRDDCNDAGIPPVRHLPAHLIDASAPSPSTTQADHDWPHSPPYINNAPGTQCLHIHDAAESRIAHCARRARLDAHH